MIRGKIVDMKHFYRLKKIILENDGELSVLKKYGFKRLNCTNSESNRVWINKSLGIVAKIPYICAYGSKLKGKIPTLSFEVNAYFRCFIQPLAERHDLAKAERAILKMNGGWDNIDEEDIAKRNCGWYQGKAVIFDW